MQPVRVVDAQVGIEQLVVVLLGEHRRRRRQPEMDVLTIADDDGVHRRIEVRALDGEAELVTVVRQRRRHIDGEELRRDLPDHPGHLNTTR